MRVLNAEDVKQALPMPLAVETAKTAFAALASGRAVVPLRSQIQVVEGEIPGDTLVMPAYLQGGEEGTGALAVKIVSIFPGNAETNLARIQAAALVVDPHTGVPVACLEASSLTGIRTAAASAAATDLLARPDSRKLAMFGAGVQARTHLEAICTVRPIETVWIVSPTRSRIEEMIRVCSGRGPIPDDMRIAATPAEALADADVICTTTTSSEPVFEDADVRPGTHINAVGSYKPEVAEIPAATVVRSLVVVDERSAAWEEAGDLIQPLQAGLIEKDHIHAELGEVILGRRAGRSSPDEVTLFKSVGNAVQDAAAAQAVLQTAEQRDLGVQIPWP